MTTRFLDEIFNFSEDCVTPELAADLMAPEWLRFEPKKFTANFFRKTPRYKPKEHIPIVRSADWIGWMRLWNDDEEMFRVSGDGSSGGQELGWTLPEGRQLTEEQIVYLTGLPGFNSALLLDPEDAYGESFDQRTPGRRTDVLDVRFQPTARMWFGEKAFEYIPRNRLLSFPEANRIEELPSGAVFIELYADPFAAALPESRAKQQAFRDWVWLDELEEMAPGLPRDKKDPTFQIETGNFPHGGIRRVTQWMGEDGRPTRSSRAVKKISVEYGEGGEVVWKETVKI